jgi:hypothetical protein
MLNILYKKVFVTIYHSKWQRGGMVTQRIANPCIPVRFRALPPKKNLVLMKKKSKLSFLHSSVAQLVEQLTVNQLVAGSSPARGAKIILLLKFQLLKLE